MNVRSRIEQPVVSIVIPVLDGEKYVGRCVASMRSQRYPNDRYELIIVDNGSRDKTWDRLRDEGVDALQESRRGRAQALNVGVRAARGEFILTTDITCVAEPDWIPRVLESFGDPNVGCVAGEIKQLVAHDSYISGFQARNNYMSAMHARTRKPPLLPFADGANASFRREVFDNLGLFDESFFKGADVEMCYRMLLGSEYQIAFNENAVVWEEGEPTLAALLKQRFKIGMASYMLGKKFVTLRGEGNSDEIRVKLWYWEAHRQFRRICHCGSRYAQAMTGRMRLVEAHDDAVKLAMSYVQDFGSLYAWAEHFFVPKKYRLNFPPRLQERSCARNMKHVWENPGGKRKETF